MWPADLSNLAVERLKADPRIQSVTPYSELPKAPKPEGFRVVDADGKTWDWQVVTTAPPGGGSSQTGWD